jgi:hypothetical protein
MNNTGINTWTQAGLYRLGSQNPQDNKTWGINRVDVTSDVLPNSTDTFAFTIKAPAKEGSYNFQWRMIQNKVGWFGHNTTNKVIIVRDSAKIDHTDPPGKGIVSRREEMNTNENALLAFDNSTTTKWQDNAGIPSTSAPSWIKIQLPSAIVVNGLSLFSANDLPESDPANFTLKGSTNDSTWITLGTWSYQNWTERMEEKYFSFSNTAYYNYYRLEISKNLGNVALTQLSEIKLYGPAGVSAINDLNSKSRVSMFPNPLNQDMLTIKLDGYNKMENIHVKITNLQGQMVFQKSFRNNKAIEINTKGLLKSSLCLVTVQTEQTTTYNKLIVR